MINVIYKIRNVVNNKFYVGSTVNARIRFQHHKRRLKKGTHQSPHLQAAWNKYGEDCFKFEVIEQLDNPEGLLAAEQVWLDEHHGKPHCYNCAAYADAPMRGKKHTPEAALKCKEAGLRCPRGEASVLYGVPRSEETKKKIGDIQRGVPKGPGRKISEEGMVKIRASVAAGNFDHWTGRKHTEESKVKMSKAVIAIDPQGNETVYSSITELRTIMGMRSNTINEALKHGQPLAHKKNKYYLWSFKYVV